MIDFFETRLENLESKEDKKNSSSAAKKLKNKKLFITWKRANSI